MNYFAHSGMRERRRTSHRCFAFEELYIPAIHPLSVSAWQPTRIRSVCHARLRYYNVKDVEKQERISVELRRKERLVVFG